MKGEKKQSFPKLHGAWNSHFQITTQDGLEQLLWHRNHPHEHPSRQVYSHAQVLLTCI